ncbi:hypothetical protein PISMIDRAFT_17204 [Pisolithus microcarpus 441]|uniref:Uncharacterized protein n=1 Tax=Pisolithus microcarpus 441 TaxID=765257 RepID=A0A0C9Z3H7_9AGAM|nr:hypothetical protein BKA83DRAFT_17204 [Pisolithus microcarpus]KIK14568.1 hypothetical protein PISMIDRAFT_17204 [Pisolithus microcarpus 441]
MSAIQMNPQTSPWKWSIYPGEYPNLPLEMAYLPWGIPKTPLGNGLFTLENPPN